MFFVFLYLVLVVFCISVFGISWWVPSEGLLMFAAGMLQAHIPEKDFKGKGALSFHAFSIATRTNTFCE